MSLIGVYHSERLSRTLLRKLSFKAYLLLYFNHISIYFFQHFRPFYSIIIEVWKQVHPPPPLPHFHKIYIFSNECFSLVSFSSCKDRVTLPESRPPLRQHLTNTMVSNKQWNYFHTNELSVTCFRQTRHKQRLDWSIVILNIKEKKPRPNNFKN